MDNSYVKKEIQKILMKSLCRESIKDDSENDLITLYGINSIDALEIFINIETTFDIQIPEEDLSSDLFISLDFLCEYILHLISQQNKI